VGVGVREREVSKECVREIERKREKERKRNRKNQSERGSVKCSSNQIQREKGTKRQR